MRFVWLDLETTGLNPENRYIIQIGRVATDVNLVEIARFERRIGYARGELTSHWDPAASAMHTNSGLADAWNTAPFNLDEVETLARAFVLEHGGEAPVMAGNSTHFDRGFLAEHMPKLLALFHHRVLDVSFFKVLGAAWGFPPVNSAPVPHTALADLERSIADFKAYKAVFFKDTIREGV